MSAVTNNGETALQLAKKKGCKQVCQVLEDALKPTSAPTTVGTETSVAVAASEGAELLSNALLAKEKSCFKEQEHVEIEGDETKPSARHDTQEKYPNHHQSNSEAPPSHQPCPHCAMRDGELDQMRQVIAILSAALKSKDEELEEKTKQLEEAGMAQKSKGEPQKVLVRLVNNS